MTDDGEVTMHQPPRPAPGVRRLLSLMEELPVRPNAALQVAWLCDDPRSSARSVGAAVERDPVLTARVLRIANSAMYALRVPAANAHRGVAVLGLSTVKALAVLAACGPQVRRVPDGLWEHSSLVAASARLVASRVGVDADDAFAMGLLHELGIALLESAVPHRWPLVIEAGAGHDAERAAFGITHAEAAELVFRAWKLPDEIQHAVTGHVQPLRPGTPPLARALLAGEALAALAADPMPHCHAPGASTALAMLGLDTATCHDLAHRAKETSEGLAGLLAA